MPNHDREDFMAQLLAMLEAVEERPDPAELRGEIAALPQRQDAVWAGFLLDLSAVLGDSMHSSSPAEVQATLCVLMRSEGPEANVLEVCESAAEAEQLFLSTVLDVPGENMGIFDAGLASPEPYRPALIEAPDAQHAFALGNLLRGTDIEVQVDATGTLATLRDQLQSEFIARAAEQAVAMKPLPMFGNASDQAVNDFLAAFQRFVTHRVWEVIPADKPVFVEWTDEAGQRFTAYGCVMGELGEAFGMVFFDDWLTYTEQMHNAHIEAYLLSNVEGLEAVNLGGDAELDPADWARVQRVTPEADPQHVPVLQRRSVQGTLPRRLPLHLVTGVLEVLAGRAQKRPGRHATSVTGTWQGVQVRYPGQPLHELTAAEAAGTVTLDIRDAHGGPALRVVGPADLSLGKMHKELSPKVPQDLRDLLPLSLLRPMPGTGDEAGHLGGLAAFDLEDMLVWEKRQDSPDALLWHVTRREGLTWMDWSVQATFSPEPPQGLSWERLEGSE
ncbi:hypothetical protein [Deinococcus radiophilus]|uniref:Uncharacterized protein n=1 Tax=Deinococcus radiophilus TaxID=32062 RepID=A0A431W6A8_9DEIO|nr:hypothetical protein [Deinococcus radiophilus]RTR30946.1 hypothetical protein EJ104_01495 [Deinococcus radiophilus]UFA49531.1 hypothetical protein LMT64_06370 [Deinococcus radiophilus]